MECKRYEDLRIGRFFEGSFERLLEVMPSLPRSDLPASVGDVGRSEVLGFMLHLMTLLPNRVIQQIVQEEIRAVRNPHQQPTAFDFVRTALTPPTLPTPTFDHVSSLHHEQFWEFRDFRPSSSFPRQTMCPAEERTYREHLTHAQCAFFATLQVIFC